MNGDMLRALNKIGPHQEPNRTPQIMTCLICEQTIDMRSIAQTAHHNKSEHVPLTEAELSALQPHHDVRNGQASKKTHKATPVADG